VFGVLAPTAVYKHPTAIAHPFRWALVHGLFVLGLSASSVLGWRINEEQALKDSLTSLPNRRLFTDRLQHALARAARTDSVVALLFIDLDRFKQVNDTLGHAVGDELLRTVASRIRAAVRASDTAARVGGDEFAVLLENADEDGVRVVAARIVQSVSRVVEIRDRSVVTGASVGVATSRRGVTLEDLFREADEAMYEAKSAGGSAFAFASSSS
jgi:diguanylate cyclase (GGDEF)-like protein